MHERGSCTKSDETTSSSVTSKIPLRGPAAASRQALMTSSYEASLERRTVRSTTDTSDTGTREAMPDGLGGARGGGDDVVGRRAPAAPVLLARAVDRLLRRGRGVHRRHEALRDAEPVVDHLG